MRQYRSRVARVAIVATAVLGLALPAFAQAPAPQAPPAGPVKQLSMEDAIGLALQNNLSLRVERINPELQDLAIAQARTVWTPNLTGSLSTASRTSPISGFFSGATDKLTSENVRSNVGANQVLPWGANYTLGWDTTRNQSNSVYDSPNPSLASNLNFSFTQPLLRNLKTDAARNQLVVSKMNREISDIDLRQTVLTTVRNVKYALLGRQGGRRRVAGCPAVARSRPGSAQEQPVEGRDRHHGARSTSSRPRPKWRAARRR